MYVNIKLQLLHRRLAGTEQGSLPRLLFNLMWILQHLNQRLLHLLVLSLTPAAWLPTRHEKLSCCIRLVLLQALHTKAVNHNPRLCCPS